MKQSRRVFERALALDPGNIEAMVGPIPGLAKSSSVAGRPHRSFQSAGHLAYLSSARSSVVSSNLTTIS
jgi:hypothetical protein